MGRVRDGYTRKTGINEVDRALDDVERKKARKGRTKWTSLPDVKQLEEGERHIYDDGTNLHFITKANGKLYTAQLTKVS